MRIVIDMNLPAEWVPTLAQHGFEAKHWSSIGAPQAEDSEIMEWANLNGYVVFTHDLDFGALLAASGADRPSIFQVRTLGVRPLGRRFSCLDAFRQKLKAMSERLAELENELTSPDFWWGDTFRLSQELMPSLEREDWEQIQQNWTRKNPAWHRNFILSLSETQIQGAFDLAFFLLASADEPSIVQGFQILDSISYQSGYIVEEEKVSLLAKLFLDGFRWSHQITETFGEKYKLDALWHRLGPYIL